MQQIMSDVITYPFSNLKFRGGLIIQPILYWSLLIQTGINKTMETSVTLSNYQNKVPLLQNKPWPISCIAYLNWYNDIFLIIFTWILILCGECATASKKVIRETLNVPSPSLPSCPCDHSSSYSPSYSSPPPLIPLPLHHHHHHPYHYRYKW